VLRGLNEYNVIAGLDPHNDGGKPTSFFSGIQGCDFFNIMGGKGTFSVLHRDHHGVMTTVRSEEGKKLWLSCAQLSWDDILPWAKACRLSDSAEVDSLLPGGAFAISIGPGDLWIQPAGTLHGAYCVTDCLMTGTMSWHEKSMLQVVEASLQELQYPEVTNEPASKDFRKYICKIQQVWHTQTAWKFGDQYSRFGGLVKVS
jgi:hypothetical protein